MYILALTKPAGDENLLATWFCEGDEMQKRINLAVPDFKIDLQWLDGENTPVVFNGIKTSRFII